MKKKKKDHGLQGKVSKLFWQDIISTTLSPALGILKQRQSLEETCRQDDPSLAQSRTDQLLLCQLNRTDCREALAISVTETRSNSVYLSIYLFTEGRGCTDYIMTMASYL